MDVIEFRLALIVLGLIVTFLFAFRFSLFSQDGVRHMHRYYYGVIMQTFFYALILTAEREILLANASIAVVVGCVIGIVIYLFSKRWFHRHFDGEALFVEPRRKKIVLQIVLSMIVYVVLLYAGHAFSLHNYALLGVTMIAWTMGSALCMAHLWKLEKEVGQPIFEREALPPRAAN